MTRARTGQAPEALSREQFGERFRRQFFDPAFDAEHDAIGRLEAIAWDGYEKARKAPRTAKAGAGFHDPDYELSVEWRQTRDRLLAAQARWADAAAPSRVLLVCASPRNDGSCPGEQSKSHRLTKIAAHVLQEAGVECDLLDLSLLSSDYQRRIHPCKGCGRPRCRCATGRARVIRTTSWARSTTGWRRSTSAGRSRMRRSS